MYQPARVATNGSVSAASSIPSRSPGGRPIASWASESTLCTSPSRSSSSANHCGPWPKRPDSAAAVIEHSAPCVDQRAQPLRVADEIAARSGWASSTR